MAKPRLLTTDFRVTGMTCGHCGAAVAREVGLLPGVADVAVDVGAGRLTVHSAAEIDRAQLAAAVDDAGYALADA